MRNLIEATPKSVKRFVLTTSAGVDRSNKIPFSILNLFGAEDTALQDALYAVMACLRHSFVMQPQANCVQDTETCGCSYVDDALPGAGVQVGCPLDCQCSRAQGC